MHDIPLAQTKPARSPRHNGLALGAHLAAAWSWIGIVGGTPLVSTALSGDVASNSLVSYALLGVCVLAFAWVALRGARVPFSNPPGFLRPLVSPRGWACLMTVLLVLVGLGGLTGSLVLYRLSLGSAICLGTCAAVVQLACVVEQLGNRSTSPFPMVALAFGASSLLNTAVTLIPMPWRVYALLLLACISPLGLRTTPKAPTTSHQPASKQPSASEPILPALGSFSYGFVFIVIWWVGATRGGLETRDEATVVQSLGICAFCAVIYIFACAGSARGHDVLASTLHRAIFAIYVVGTMFFSLTVGTLPTLASTLVASATALFEITLIAWAASRGRRAAQSFGLLMGSLTAGQLASHILLEGPLADVLRAADPVIVGYACLFVLLPTALAVFIPLDLKQSRPPATGAPQTTGLPVDFCARFGLSPREEQVAELLAAGRSLPYIQQALSISEGTAKTHLRHIYDKAGVHRKQDFLDLVRSPSSTDSTGQS